MGTTLQAIVEISIVRGDGSQHWISVCEWELGKDYEMMEVLNTSAVVVELGWPPGNAGSSRRSKVDEEDIARGRQWMKARDLLRMEARDDTWCLAALRTAVGVLVTGYGMENVRVLFYRT